MLLIAYLRKAESYVINSVSEEGSMLLCYYVINCVPEDGSMLLCY
jgi:hypothetical protein